MSIMPSWHSLEPQSVINKLGTDRIRGLAEKEVQDRLYKNGPNELPTAKKRTWVSVVLHQFLSPLIYLLMIASGIAFYVGEKSDSLVILMVVVLNAMIGAFQEGRAEKSLEALRVLTRLKARVIRDGRQEVIESRDIVAGDLLVLEAGNAVPSDARLVEAAAMAVAEAALTGESLPVVKSVDVVPEGTLLADRTNMVFAGTHITAGRGLAVVVATGVENEIGKIASLTSSTVQPKTQLEVRIQQFGRYLVVVALSVFGVVMAIGLWRGIAFAELFMVSISQMVSLVPEGLPVAMTIALAVGVQRMSRRGTVVRRLSAVETLGSTTVICADKTGTLTYNEMVAVEIFFPDEMRKVSVEGAGYVPVGSFSSNGNKILPEKDISLRRLSEACILCNDAQLLAPDESKRTWRVVGDPTEGALLSMALKAGVDIERTRKRNLRRAELPFNSVDKMMATQNVCDGKSCVYIKGAPEILLDFCSTVWSRDEVRFLEVNQRNAIQEQAIVMANAALRVLAIGFVEDAYIDGALGFQAFRGRVTLLGLVGEQDSPRKEVFSAIRECQAAGIKPVMVTGDHKVTGLAIAKSLGISQDKDLVLDGQELELLSDDELAKKIHRVRVFARVHPAQKLRIVEAFQRSGEIVAMTGDGVNDAPALVRANVGIAMGISGTEVAKEASKIVITDDNFATIVAAISEGRLVYQNIRKLILFLFVTSIDEVLILFLALVLDYPVPLAAVQILWINVVTEGTLTVNLIMEPPEGDEMTRPPTPPKQPLLDRALLSRMPLMIAASVVSTFGWFIFRTSMEVSPAQVQTETFTVLAVCQWFNVLNCRSAIRSALSWSVLRNPWLIGGLLLGIVLHFAVIYWKPLSQIFHTVPLGLEEVLAIGAVASLVLWVEELRKLLARRNI